MAQHSTQSFLILLLLQGSVGLEWASSGSLPNGTIIPTCSGQDVVLGWNFTQDVEEHLMNVEWHFEPKNGSEALLATQTLGNFFAVPRAVEKLQFIPNAGIRLQNVASQDAGTYTVNVNLNVHGSVVTDAQTVDVQVSDDSLTTDGQLHVRMLPEAMYDNSTQQFHVQLACGDFSPVWAPRVAVVWKLPSNQTLSTTSYDNGRFLLSVPNPVTNGEYTCTIDNTSPASLCVLSGSPLSGGAQVDLDGTEVRFNLMDAKMNLMQQQMVSMEIKHEHDLAVLTSKLEKAVQQVYFYAIPSVVKTDNTPPIFDDVVHNVGSGYSTSTGRFTAPVSGLYLFMVTATSAGVDQTVKVYLSINNGENVSALGMSYAAGSNQIVVHLSAGQYAYVTLDRGQLEEWHDSSFVGVLIQADV